MHNILRKKIFIITLLIIAVSIFKNSYSQQNQLTVAVLDFKDNSPFASDDLKPMQQGLANVMITTFSQVNGLKVVERSQLTAITEEMALGQSGMLDESSAQQVGKLLGAQYLVLGSFMKGMKKDIRIDCRIVRTETGVTVKAEEVTGKIKDIIKLMSKIGEKVVKNLDVKINKQDKKAIKSLDSNCSYDVVLVFFKALEYKDNKKYKKADELFSQVLKKCPKFKRAQIKCPPNLRPICKPFLTQDV